MGERDSPLTVKVTGDFACFTRPEFGAERVSYEVMTPSAARGILEAIFWKPEFSYSVRSIEVLQPIKHFSILRNEVNTWQSASSAKSPDYRYFADDDRAQRHTLCLRDVGYIIKTDINLKKHANADVAKYRDQFRRRVKKGQCHHQPYFGTREFSAYFDVPTGEDKPIDRTDDLGLMLLDIEFTSGEGQSIDYLTHDENGSQVTSGSAKPKFFHAELKNGVLVEKNKLRLPIR
jgi:CRISPR-associated protein Cas5d